MSRIDAQDLQGRPGLFDEETTRSLLDQLLTDSRLYRRSKDYKDLLEFVVRLKDFAPFNAMLLQVQKPGLKYAASARDWLERFGRWPKEGVRPLLIPWPFGPVALVYDVADTEGRDLPEDVFSFPRPAQSIRQDFAHLKNRYRARMSRFPGSTQETPRLDTYGSSSEGR